MLTGVPVEWWEAEANERAMWTAIDLLNRDKAERAADGDGEVVVSG